MLQAYINWVRAEALPFWAAHGFDDGRNRFRERLDLAGKPLDVAHRAMVQARQIYVFAHAAHLGWLPEGDDLAARAMTSLQRDFTDPGGPGAFAFSIHPGSGAVASVRLDAYTHAFLLFAIAWLYRRTQDAALLSLANRILGVVDSALTDSRYGGLFDEAPVSDRGKRQNPLMHLLEACLFLADTAPGRGYEERSDALVALFRRRLFSPTSGVLLEHFAEDWSAHADPARRDVWEPGHHMEWVWLLDRHRQQCGGQIAPEADRLFTTARDHGRAPNGLLYDEVGADLRPRKTSHRLWPHSEAIKAAIVRGDRNMADQAATLLMETFLRRPFPGGWTDHVDSHGTPLVDYVPASSLYHLVLAAAEAASVAPSSLLA